MKSLLWIMAMLMGLTLAFARGAGAQQPAAPSPTQVDALAEPEATPDDVLREMERRRREEEERRNIQRKMALMRLQLRQQFRDNEEWQLEALEKEADLVRDAEEEFEDRDYRDAKDLYLDAIEITYPQWVFTDEMTSLIRDDDLWFKREGLAPSVQKRRFSLSTEYTRLALTRLAVIDDLIREYDLVLARLRADESYEAGRFVEAYRRYTHALNLARKMGASRFARGYIQEIEARRSHMLAEASAPLDTAAAALKAGNPGLALAALQEFEETYAALPVRDLLERYKAMNASPEVEQARREQAAIQLMARAETALEHEDYRGALRTYRRASLAYPDTEAGRRARETHAALLRDPEFQQAMKLQEARWVSQAMLVRAGTFEKWGKRQEALEVYDQIMSRYPDTEWDAQAA